ncbi:MAG: CRISPR system precrRNA processing endoribonuclease RAMP protein Cas6 [Deltaproteobacteria bacterium]|nr:CRISPR system precrRNA processing endoribonuclease RAMP protein Cas6 [Deltaproteobacteria bacterium]
MNLFETLRHCSIRFTCSPQDPRATLPSALWWREQLELQCRKVCCVASRKSCPGCPVRKSCMVTFFFQPELYFEDKKTFKGSAPPPFSLQYPSLAGTAPPEGPFFLRLTLFGPAIEKFPYWVVVLERLGKGRRFPFTLQSATTGHAANMRELYSCARETVSCRPDATVPAPLGIASRAELSLITPLRLMKNKRPLLKPTFSNIVESICQRYRSLNLLYGDAPAPDRPEDLLAKAETIRLSSDDMRWRELSVYSRHQTQNISFSGLQGSIHLDGDLAPFDTLLQYGAGWGIGKGTALGLGRYKLL